MATMTFEVRFNWAGNQKPNIFKRKMYESEYAQVNNWLKKRTDGQKMTVSKLQELIDAYQLVYPDLRMHYSMTTTGELIATCNDGNSILTYELGNSI